MTDKEKIAAVLDRLMCSGGVDGEHHKAWVIDQVVRILTNCKEEQVTAVDCNGSRYGYTRLGESKEYKQWIKEYKDGEDGPDSCHWDIGIPP